MALCAIAQLFRLPELITDKENDGAHQSKVKRFFSFAETSVSIGSHSRLRTLQHFGSPIGIAFVGVGILVLVCGTARFFHTQNVMVRGQFIPSRVEVFVLACIAGALLFAALGVMISVATGTL